MYDPEDEACEMAGKYMDNGLLDYFSHSGAKTQIVGQAELLPLLLAKQLWAKRMANRPVIYVIDNEAAKYVLIKGYSPSRQRAPHSQIPPERTGGWVLQLV